MNYVNIISAGGLMNQEYIGQQLFYDYLVNEYLQDGMNFIEVGVCTGKSITYITDKIRKKKLNVNIYGVDHFEGSAEHKQYIFHDEIKENPLFLYDLCVQNLKGCNVYDHINLIKSKSIDASNSFKDNFFDVIVIDAGHDYDSVKQDIQHWLPKLKNNGIIAGDDYHSGWPGVFQAVNECFGSKFKLYTEENMHERWLPASIWYVKQ